VSETNEGQEMRIITPTSNIIGIISPSNWLNNRFIKLKIKSKKYLRNDIINMQYVYCRFIDSKKIYQRA